MGPGGRSIRAARRARAVAVALVVAVVALASFAAPPLVRAAGPAEVPIRALDAGLARYLAPYGTRVGVRVLDLSTGAAFVSNADSRFLTASSVKVWLMCALIERRERAGQALSEEDRAQLASMIRVSDNIAASEIYSELGRSRTLSDFARRHHIGGFIPNERTWSFSQITPRAMTELLRQLAQGRILSAAHRRYALDLMRSVIASQRFGVGTTAPAGATVAMKNGWVPALDGLWIVNSSGIVTVDARSYIISVFTQGNASLGSGVAIVDHVAAAVARAMVRGQAVRAVPPPTEPVVPAAPVKLANQAALDRAGETPDAHPSALPVVWGLLWTRMVVDATAAAARALVDLVVASRAGRAGSGWGVASP